MERIKSMQWFFFFERRDDALGNFRTNISPEEKRRLKDEGERGGRCRRHYWQRRERERESRIEHIEEEDEGRRVKRTIFARLSIFLWKRESCWNWGPSLGLNRPSWLLLLFCRGEWTGKRRRGRVGRLFRRCLASNLSRRGVMGKAGNWSGPRLGSSQIEAPPSSVWIRTHPPSLACSQSFLLEGISWNTNRPSVSLSLEEVDFSTLLWKRKGRYFYSIDVCFFLSLVQCLIFFFWINWWGSCCRHPITTLPQFLLFSPPPPPPPLLRESIPSLTFLKLSFVIPSPTTEKHASWTTMCLNKRRA